MVRKTNCYAPLVKQSNSYNCSSAVGAPREAEADQEQCNLTLVKLFCGHPGLRSRTFSRRSIN
mgnify:CR=1 FL=1